MHDHHATSSGCGKFAYDAYHIIISVLARATAIAQIFDPKPCEWTHTRKTCQQPALVILHVSRVWEKIHDNVCQDVCQTDFALLSIDGAHCSWLDTPAAANPHTHTAYAMHSQPLEQQPPPSFSLPLGNNHNAARVSTMEKSTCKGLLHVQLLHCCMDF